jgi:hypothetical protein
MAVVEREKKQKEKKKLSGGLDGGEDEVMTEPWNRWKS